MPDFVDYLKSVGRGERLKRDLTYDESVDAISHILDGRATDAQIGGFLIAQRVKGEAVDEIRGFVDGVRSRFLDGSGPPLPELLDLAVPYDGKAKTLQLAPAIALILAASGLPVLLHGDRNVPTKEGVGPGDVLALLGMRVEGSLAEVRESVHRDGFGYLSAERLIPAWSRLLPLRRELGLRTALNTVEKFFNPFDAPYQVSGFFHANYIDRIRSVGTGTSTSWIVQGEEGSVECPLGRATRVFSPDGNDDLSVDPDLLGAGERERIALPPDPPLHARENLAVIEGREGPAFDQAVLSAGLIFHLIGLATSHEDGVRRARLRLESGAVSALYRRISQRSRLGSSRTKRAERERIPL